MGIFIIAAQGHQLAQEGQLNAAPLHYSIFAKRRKLGGL